MQIAESKARPDKIMADSKTSTDRQLAETRKQVTKTQSQFRFMQWTLGALLGL